MSETELIGLINSKQCVITVLGINYLSVPLVVKIAENGFKVKLFSWEGGTVVFPGSDEIFSGHIGIQLNKYISAGQVNLTTSQKNAANAHIYIVCEPPQSNKPDFCFIDKTDLFLRNLSSKGKLIIFHLTSHPDFVITFTLPGLEYIKSDTHWKAGSDFYLSWLEGKIFRSNGTIDYNPPMLLKGITNSCSKLTGQLYSHIGINLLKQVKS